MNPYQGLDINGKIVVVADLNMDMIGRNKTPRYVDPPTYKLIEPGEVFVVGPSISSDELGETVDAVATGYGTLKVNHFYDTTAPDAPHLTRSTPGPVWVLSRCSVNGFA